MELDKIYNEDCIETLKRMSDNSVDLVVTSPPYNKNAYASDKSNDTRVWGKLRGRQIAYDVYSDDMPQEAYEKWQRRVLDECMRVLKPTGSIFYNHKDILVNGLSVVPKFVYDYPLHQQIIWDRGSSPALDKHYFFPITEYIYWIVKEPKQMYFDRDKSWFKNTIWRVNAVQEPNHPAPFPLKLIRSIIASSSPEGGVIYDPFMGSGTTAVATIQVGGAEHTLVLKYLRNTRNTRRKELVQQYLKA